MPLHEMIPNKGRQAINTTIMFKKGGIKVTPGTKLCFYSDPDGL